MSELQTIQVQSVINAGVLTVTATVKLQMPDGTMACDAATGGNIAVTIAAVIARLTHAGDVVVHRCHTNTGFSGDCRAYIALIKGKREYCGNGHGCDITVAIANACLDAIQKVAQAEERMRKEAIHVQ